MLNLSPKVCKVDGCEKPHFGKGYCNKHYRRMRKYGTTLFVPARLKKCSIEECSSPQLCKGLCQKHYYAHIRTHGTNNGICKIAGCNKPTLCKNLCKNHYAKSIYIKRGTKLPVCAFPDCTVRPKNGPYCSKHKIKIATRLRRNLPIHIPSLRKGEYNTHWKGGVSPYPNQSLFKRNKKIKFKMVNHTCELCGDVAYEAHHKDFSKTNHDIYNLSALCKHCHNKMHTGFKYKRTLKTRHEMQLSKLWGQQHLISA